MPASMLSLACFGGPRHDERSLRGVDDGEHHREVPAQRVASRHLTDNRTVIAARPTDNQRYAHVLPGMQAEAAQRLADSIFDEPGEGNVKGPDGDREHHGEADTV